MQYKVDRSKLNPHFMCYKSASIVKLIAEKKWENRPIEPPDLDLVTQEFFLRRNHICALGEEIFLFHEGGCFRQDPNELKEICRTEKGESLTFAVDCNEDLAGVLISGGYKQRFILLRPDKSIETVIVAEDGFSNTTGRPYITAIRHATVSSPIMFCTTSWIKDSSSGKYNYLYTVFAVDVTREGKLAKVVGRLNSLSKPFELFFESSLERLWILSYSRPRVLLLNDEREQDEEKWFDSLHYFCFAVTKDTVIEDHPKQSFDLLCDKLYGRIEGSVGSSIHTACLKHDVDVNFVTLERSTKSEQASAAKSSCSVRHHSSFSALAYVAETREKRKAIHIRSDLRWAVISEFTNTVWVFKNPLGANNGFQDHISLYGQSIRGCLFREDNLLYILTDKALRLYELKN